MSKLSGRTEYEDNFGYWDIPDSDELAFYHHVRNASVPRVCTRCHSTVLLMPSNTMCARCCEALEFGGDNPEGK
jgi:hypothetical protein